MTEFTAAEKRRAAERELALRRYVYPRRIAEGKLTVKKAEAEIAVMEAIAEDYRKLEEAEKREGELKL